MKYKRIIIFAAVFAMIFTNINLSVIASYLPNLSIESINTGEIAWAGNTFRVDVTVRNNAGYTMERVFVSSSVEGGPLSVSGAKDSLERSIEANSSATFSFYFKASESAKAGEIAQIRFAVSQTGSDAPYDRSDATIVIYENPQAEQPHRYDIITAMYPKQVSIGQTIKMGFRFSNIGADSTDVRASISFEEGFEYTSLPTAIIGDMVAGQSEYVEFNFKVTDKVQTGLRSFTLKIESKNGHTLPDYPIGIYVEDSGEVSLKTPELIFSDINLPENIKRGDKFTVSAILENTGADAKNILIEIASDNIASTSHDTVSIASLKEGEYQKISFELIVNETAADNYNRITLTADGENSDSKGEKPRKVTQHTGVNVLPKDEEAKDFKIDISPEIPERVKPGEDFKVIFTVTNNGSSDEKNVNVNVSIPTASGITNKTQSAFVIPEFKAGTSITREITYMALPEAVQKSVTFDITVFEMKQSFVIYVENPDAPKLAIENIKIPANINIGETIEVELTVANVGEIKADNIILTVTAPEGILQESSGRIGIDNLKPGEKQTEKIKYRVQSANYGYNAFKAEVSFGTGDKIEQFFGTLLSLSDLQIESINAPSSALAESNFNVEVTIKNTGADAQDITLTLTPQAGVISKSQNQVKIDTIKTGETVVKSFTFMALETASSGYSPINVTLTKGTEQMAQQFTGTNIINPKKEEDPAEKSDVPVVIISKFSYETVDNSPADNNDNQNNQGGNTLTPDFGGGVDTVPGIMPEVYDGAVSEDIFEKTRMISGPVMVESYPMPGGAYNSGTGGGSSGTSTPVNQANIDTNAVLAGNSFIFSFELLNMHRNIAVKDLKITISSVTLGTGQGGVFNPKAGSNTFFVEYLGPKETYEDKIELLVKPDAAPDSYGLQIRWSYKSEDGVEANYEEIINIPVQQEIRFSIGDLPPINDVQMGDEVYIPVNFVNLGKGLIYNVIVKVQGDGFFNPEGTWYANNVEAGKTASKEFYLMTTMPGFLNGEFIFNYEDADGNVFEAKQPFSFNVMGGEMDMSGMERPTMPENVEYEIDPDTGMPVIDPETGMPVMKTTGEDEEESPNILMWIIIGASGLVLIAGVIIIIVAVKRKKAKMAAEDDEDNE